MGIALDEISVLESVLEEKLKKERMRFKMSVHFVKDRMNHPRNIPPITITELYSIFNRLINVHISKLAALKHNDTFNIRCTKTDINMPCAVSKKLGEDGIVRQENIVITVMRKKEFKSKDPIEFRV